METKTPIEKIVDGLRKTAVELEKLQVQASLGKAEAKEKYDDMRKKYNNYLRDAEQHVDKVKADVKSKYKDLKPLIESLHVQFALGKAEAKEVVDEQKKKFSKTLSDLESFFKEKENK